MSRTILILFLPLLFFSCRSDKTILIWSDRKEMADVIEVYNRNDDGNRAIFQYKKNLLRAYAGAETKPDIIIGEDLNNALIKKDMISLSNMKTGEIDQALEKGTDLDGDRRLLPLAYSPDILLFRRGEKRVDNSRPALSLSDIQTLGIAFNKESRRGYSPYWDDDFLLTVLNLFGTDFTGGKEEISWNSENLEKAVVFLQDWYKKNSDEGDMDAFNKKYMYDNRLILLQEGRILFSSMNLEDFMTLSDFMTEDLDFKYITRNNRIDPGKIIFGGIYRKTGKLEKADLFLSWLADPSVQSTIIQSALKDNTGCFGFLGGFSSLDLINSRDFPVFYPRLSGKIPESAFLLPQIQRPVEFLDIQKNVVVPWLLEQKSGSTGDLSDAIDKWEKLRIPF